MSQLSDKKYIQTRARSLPIYKCLVDKTWRENQFSPVVVMRKHTNGNITAGYYNIDLLCLGVKATHYYFNIEEEELRKDLGDILPMFEEIDYALAHNIIFAGHDFAMEFDIQPHKDFQLTRCILEEDSEAIPLIDIPVGKHGKPHLVAILSTDRLDALAKLRKNAGEGNYYYSVAEEENFEEYFLDNIPPGQLDCENVLKIESEDLEDDEKVARRNRIEQLFIETEQCTRLLTEEELYVDPQEEKAWIKNWNLEFSDLPARITQKQFDNYNNAMDELVADHNMPNVNLDKRYREEKMIGLANKYADNPLVIAAFYEKAVIMSIEELETIAKAHAEKLYADYPLVQLSLAIGAMIKDDMDSRFDAIYKADTIRTVIPNQATFHKSEIVNFGLIKMWQCLGKGDIGFAVKFYHLLANSGGNTSTLLPIVWASYLAALTRLIDEDDEEDEDEDDSVNE